MQAVSVEVTEILPSFEVPPEEFEELALFFGLSVQPVSRMALTDSRAPAETSDFRIVCFPLFGDRGKSRGYR